MPQQELSRRQTDWNINRRLITTDVPQTNSETGKKPGKRWIRKPPSEGEGQRGIVGQVRQTKRGSERENLWDRAYM